MSEKSGMSKRSEQMDKFEKVTHNQHEVYKNNIEYRTEVGACKGGLEATFEMFMENPSSMNFSLLESHMMRYQNILCNCRVKEE